ncbi:uncharacterized protein BDR25DRAFT_275034 [Lindgomyces ingoldianus]|uniref:Uncharacterized protein n=1 Tax=Lindgomyces ingoldianus TaxID=673940 RepID=A0ACB6RG01_9PLEO|nr:uncharacterized protein BDR25DRAFT_275034 [Lindgomyces ingoldianus]KAF2477698.1 hypothetical protein BDR25DRAFT_275034 [Lindgomyces ingoldianus]
MPPLNRGTSAYHSIHSLYWRDESGTLLSAEGSNSQAFSNLWPKLWEEICSKQSTWRQLQLPSGRQINTLPIRADILELNDIRSSFPPERQTEGLITQVAEVKHPNGLVLGMLTSRPKSLAGDDFGTWAEHFILLETQFQPFKQLSIHSTPEHRRISEQVADIFEKRLKNISKDDQWDFGGRGHFMNRVYGFVERHMPILLCLPAFPCKSPNPSKVGGTIPDLAEHIALDVLRTFVQEICKVYQPGATLWIISDGHVFSDCIGVDDTMVDTYDAKLIEIYKEKYPVEEGPVPFIQFKGLKDIFMSNQDAFSSFRESWVASMDIPHPVKTELTKPSELCRKLMLGVSGADRRFIRACIEEQEPHALQLYRGQTRFMLEDLAKVPSVEKLSTNQRKKVAAKVAQEMISRNQAYSNLVELLLPNYVRLSIHAHPNKGPKFAIRLLPKNLVRPIISLENRHEPVPAYKFQIPTPWHNSIIKIEGDELMYLARADVAKLAVNGSNFEGSWVTSPNGGYFGLKRKGTKQATEKDTSIAVVSPTQDVESQVEKSSDGNTWKILIPLRPLFSFTFFMRRVWRYIAMGS